jgi:hypothetical protein
LTIRDAVELFRHEMTNEIFHACSDDDLQDALLRSLDDVSKTVIRTYEAEKTGK